MSETRTQEQSINDYMRHTNILEQIAHEVAFALSDGDNIIKVDDECAGILDARSQGKRILVDLSNGTQISLIVEYFKHD